MAEGGNKARLVGINHVALEVGDIDQALAFYGRLFEFSLRGRSASMAFIDMGDQFIALSTGRTQAKDEDRHFGLVVDDRAPLRQALQEMGAEVLPGRGLDFIDPWGNHIQVVEYQDIQFTKAPEVLRAMELGHLDKSEPALQELAGKGIRFPQAATGEGR
jgi:catechol 2,3-dioxygenase-like lactoylglutathione lyase family enzyme